MAKITIDIKSTDEGVVRAIAHQIEKIMERQTYLGIIPRYEIRDELNHSWTLRATKEDNHAK